MVSEVQRDAIEIGYVRAERMDEPIEDASLEIIRGFTYRSIHAPTRITTDPETFAFRELRYPSRETEPIVERLMYLAEKTQAHTIVFHPDVVDSLPSLCELLPGLVAYENMDEHKSFGRTVEDMKEVFRQAPEARFIFDLNHVYTNDRSMETVKDFYEAFSDRIAHFHISGYGGFHAPFSETKEMFLLDPLPDFSRPIIHEGGAARKDLAFLKAEDNLVRSYLRDIRAKLS